MTHFMTDSIHSAVTHFGLTPPSPQKAALQAVTVMALRCLQIVPERFCKIEKGDAYYVLNSTLFLIQWSSCRGFLGSIGLIAGSVSVVLEVVGVLSIGVRRSSFFLKNNGPS